MTTVFYSYAVEDEQFRKRIESCLVMLRREGKISEWHFRKITPGEKWRGVIDERLNAAGLILLLVSPAFLDSDYCYDVEMKRALQRHSSGEAVVIPIILRPCEWNATPIKELQALPENGKAVTKWGRRDDAYLNIAKGIRAAVDKLATREELTLQQPSDVQRIPIPGPNGIRPTAIPSPSEIVMPRDRNIISPNIGHGTLPENPWTVVTDHELNSGRSRFDAALIRRDVQVPTIGTRESVVIVHGEFEKQTATESFRRRLLLSAPKHTNWPPWLDLSGDHDEADRPYIFDLGWEALLADLDLSEAMAFPHLDFWRMEPRGVFYHLRGLEDDFARARLGPAPGTQLDFMLQISRTAEVISIGLSFARSLGCDELRTSLIFGFRWSGLAGRHLTSWVEPSRFLRPIGGVANQNQITTSVAIPLATPHAGVAPYVESVVRDPFALFGGREFASPVIEEIVNKAIG
jgi:hypothetical protein